MDSTLDLLGAVTREFGHLMRQFRDKTSDKFHTVELPSEMARKRGMRSLKKKLNLNTYKFHSLGDYVATIRLFGTTDSYSTQVVSLTTGAIDSIQTQTYRGNSLIDLSNDFMD